MAERTLGRDKGGKERDEETQEGLDTHGETGLGSGWNSIQAHTDAEGGGVRSK